MASPEAPPADAAAAAPAAKGSGKKGAPPPKGLGKGGPPAPGKAPPPMPKGACQRPASREALGPKLRPLFWTGVNQVSSDSVWANLEPAVQFDKALLERSFCLGDSRTPTGKGGSAPGSRSASEEPRKRVRVLDDRTSQLLAIAFNRLPPPERLAAMVDSFEDFPDGLTSEGVLALHSAVSEHRDAVEQIRLVAATPEAVAQLDLPERLLLRVSEVPFCTIKLACGALIVGSAKDLKDLRVNGQKVGVCCQDLRHSKLLRKFVATALAVGNFLNRGTARSGLRRVVLPESLLKLEELRGNAPAAAESSGEGAPTLLDFVAQSLVNEEGAKGVEFVKEAEHLLEKARAAAGVSLEETDVSCRQINAEAVRAQQGLSEVPQGAGVSAVVARVDKICREASVAVDISQKAKEQLAKAQKWSCCKAEVKSCDWFTSWVQFLELLPRAFARAQEARARRLAQEEEAGARRLAQEEELRAREAWAQAGAPPRPPLASVAAAAPENKIAAAEVAAKREEAAQSLASRGSSRGRAKEAAKFDDEARIDNIDWSKLQQRATFPPPIGEGTSMHALRASAPCLGFHDKENSLH